MEIREFHEIMDQVNIIGEIPLLLFSILFVCGVWVWEFDGLQGLAREYKFKKASILARERKREKKKKRDDILFCFGHVTF